MKRISLILLLILIALSGWFVWKHPHQPHQFVSVKHCQDVNNPCYKVVMSGEPNLLINSWHKIGGYNCIDFSSLPDNTFQGYCGQYKIERVNR